MFHVAEAYISLKSWTFYFTLQTSRSNLKWACQNDKSPTVCIVTRWNEKQTFKRSRTKALSCRIHQHDILNVSILLYILSRLSLLLIKHLPREAIHRKRVSIANLYSDIDISSLMTFKWIQLFRWRFVSAFIWLVKQL